MLLMWERPPSAVRQAKLGSLKSLSLNLLYRPADAELRPVGSKTRSCE